MGASGIVGPGAAPYAGAMRPSVLIPLATSDFDPTEVAVPWRVATDAGIEVIFATEDGAPGACDPLVLTGPLFGWLGATPENVALYEAMTADPAFRAPRAWPELRADAFDALLLPGGHAKGMRQYLESRSLHALVAAFFDAGKPVGAICHGPVVLARSRTADGRSVVAGRRLTALTRPLEQVAWMLTAWKLGDYYRTYPTWVEAELREAVGEGGAFVRGPLLARYAAPFTVRDGNLLTARWPGDARGFAEAFVAMVEEASGLTAAAAAPAAN